MSTVLGFLVLGLVLYFAVRQVISLVRVIKEKKQQKDNNKKEDKQ